jgi:hypothetical protein
MRMALNTVLSTFEDAISLSNAPYDSLGLVAAYYLLLVPAVLL